MKARLNTSKNTKIPERVKAPSLYAPADETSESDGLSSTQETYNSIKALILSGEARPGLKLVHQDLATYLKVSRTPVREALERLHQEQFVTRRLRRGFYVAEMTYEEARDLYDAREALEIHALRHTMTNGLLNKKSLANLSELMNRTFTLLREGKLRERQQTDAAMHIALAEISGNRYLVRLLIQTFERITLKRRIEGYRSDRGAVAHTEHLDLLSGLKANNLSRAEKALRAHIGHARDALLNTLG
jgi:GntR family transcriptional regulator, rspAB operon transcriptional repressor